MFIRLANECDIASAENIYKNARAFMAECGNSTQWSGEYPNGYDVKLGIEKGTSYVCEDNGEVVATFHFEAEADDPTYRTIYEGNWLNNAPYGVIHRIAVKYHGKGIVDFCFNECFKIIPNLRIDTHENNIPMKKCLIRNGFHYCGIIYLENGESRVAYQKID